MTVPIAVSPSVLTPGLYLVVDLLASAAAPGVGQLRTLIMSPKSSGGDLTVDTEVRTIGDADEAATAFGNGTPGHLAAVLLFGQFPSAVVDAIAVTGGGGNASTLVVTFSGSPTADNTVLVDLMGVQFEVPWLSTDSLTEVALAVSDAIAERTAAIACTGTPVVAVLTLDAKLAGPWGNDIIARLTLKGPATGGAAISYTSSPAAAPLAAGTTEPDYTTALSNVVGEEYHYILPCLSNGDANNAASTSNVRRVYNHIVSLNEGKDAKLQQFIVASTLTVAGAIAATPDVDNASNATFGEHILCISGRGLPAQLAAREAGGRLKAISVDPAANRIGEDMSEYIGAADKIANKPTPSQSESAIGGGVSLISYTAQGIETLVRAVTTHSQTVTGAADRRLLDTQNVDGTYIIARDLRENLPLEFPQAKIAPDPVAGEDLPPQGVITPTDIKSFIITRLRFWQTEAVATQKSIDDAIADGTLIVQINASDPTQVDIVVPFAIVQPLAKTGVTVQRVQAS